MGAFPGKPTHRQRYRQHALERRARGDAQHVLDADGGAGPLRARALRVADRRPRSSGLESRLVRGLRARSRHRPRGDHLRLIPGGIRLRQSQRPRRAARYVHPRVYGCRVPRPLPVTRCALRDRLTMHTTKSPLKIAFVVTALTLGGAEMMLWKLLSRMDRRRFDPHVIALAARTDTILERFRTIGVP